MKKRQLSGFEYDLIIKELEILKTKRLNKIVEFKDRIELKFQDKIVVIRLPHSICLKSFEKKLEEEEFRTNNFTVIANNLIKGRRLESITRVEDERIISFDFNDGLILFFEMFSKGNAILTKDLKIVANLKDEEWSGRILKKENTYIFPKKRIDEFNEKTFISVKLSRLKYGNLYAKICLFSLGIDEKKPLGQITLEENEKIDEFYKNFLKNLDYFYYLKDENSVNYSLIDSKYFLDYKKVKCENLSQAIDLYHLNLDEAKIDENQEKLKRTIQIQKDSLKSLENQEQIIKQEIQKIYEHYGDVSILLDFLKIKKIDSKNIQEIEEKLKKVNAKIDAANKTVQIDLE